MVPATPLPAWPRHHRPAQQTPPKPAHCKHPELHHVASRILTRLDDDEDDHLDGREIGLFRPPCDSLDLRGETPLDQDGLETAIAGLDSLGRVHLRHDVGRLDKQIFWTKVWLLLPDALLVTAGIAALGVIPALRSGSLIAKLLTPSIAILAGPLGIAIGKWQLAQETDALRVKVSKQLDRTAPVTARRCLERR